MNIKYWRGYDLFYFGGYGQFDELAYDVVTLLKNKYLNIKRIYVRPYYKELPKCIEDVYLKNYDGCEYFDSSLKGKYSIIGINYCIVNHCDLCVFYVGKDGGAKIVLDYAKRKKKEYINFY